MFIVRRWWVRHKLQAVLTGLFLGAAWFVYQTQGAAISELYYWVVRPFQSQSRLALEEQLSDTRILELEQRLAELESQNQKFKKLLGYFESQKQPVITAPIIGRSADSWWQQVTLGRGGQDGIEAGFAVTGIGGLVGRVVQVTPHTSRVLLISDQSSRVGVKISRSRHMGFIQGQGSQMALMQFFEKVSDVRPGDTVTSSSLSRLFPAGLPIGRVKSINLERGPAPEAIVELTAPLNSLEWVTVHPFESKL